MNDEFVQHALSRGITGKQWLDNIPNIVTAYQEKWSLQIGTPFTLTWNYVLSAARVDGTKVVLKIGFPQDTEFQTEIEALSIYNGEGIAKLLEVDRESAVMLIERVVPGSPLSAIEDDEEATKILASVMKKLWKPLPDNHHFTTIEKWSQAIPRLKEKYQGKAGPLPSYLVDKAEALFKELIASSETPMLVHGDLHQDNILSSKRDGWLAIDPKGIAAEPAYETAAMLRNPYDMMKQHPNIKNIMYRRIMILSEELGIDAKRIHAWGFAQTVLSAVWSAEDEGRRWEHAIFVAEILDTMQV